MTDRKSISIVSKEVGVETHTLRFWEKDFPQIRPSTIGKGNRRYYNDNDILNILKIKFFLYEYKYTIEGLRDFLSKNKSIFKKNLDEIKQLIKINEGGGKMSDNIKMEIVGDLMGIQDKLRTMIVNIDRGLNSN